MALTDKLTAIGDAVRAKGGTTGLLTLDGMVSAINAIPTGGSDMTIEFIEHVLANVTTKDYYQGSAVGACLYVTSTNALYSWDGTAWATKALDANSVYFYQGQFYKVLGDSIWGIGNDWGDQVTRSFTSTDEDGKVAISVVSNEASISYGKLPQALGLASATENNYDSSTRLVKSVDLSGCDGCTIGTSVSSNTGCAGLQGLNYCQHFKLPINSTVYFYAFFNGLNSAGADTGTAIMERCLTDGIYRPVLMFGGAPAEGTGGNTGFSYNSSLVYACADIIFKTARSSMLTCKQHAGTFAQYMNSKPSMSSYSAPNISNSMHFDLWGSFQISSSSTSSSYYVFSNGTDHDCVFEAGSADYPVTQDDLTSWGKLSYWVRAGSTGKVILVLYTQDGAELTIPTHSYADDDHLTVLFKDAATRTRAAYDEKYSFASMFNTSATGDPRPDLTADGITYV